MNKSINQDKGRMEQTIEMIEMIEILKMLPEAQQAYLNGVAAGMATERKLAESRAAEEQPAC